jgi:hypothetical protein
MDINLHFIRIENSKNKECRRTYYSVALLVLFHWGNPSLAKNSHLLFPFFNGLITLLERINAANKAEVVPATCFPVRDLGDLALDIARDNQFQPFSLGIV